MTLDTYTGEKNGRDQPHGQGSRTYPNGDKYSGEFWDGKRHGQGTMTYADGRTYTGEFKDNKRHGQGTMTWADGA